MILHSISITNFRNIETPTTFELHPKFTAIIGTNGKGKSTILHAVRIAAGTYLLGIPPVVKRAIVESEIRRKDFGTHSGLQTPTIIKAVGNLEENIIEWTRKIPKGKVKTTSSNEDVGIIRNIAKDNFQRVNEEGFADVDLPVIAFFGTGRFAGGGRDTLRKYVSREVFKDGYYSWLDMRYSTFQYPRWLRGYDSRLEEKKEIAGTLEAFYHAIKTAVPFIQKISFNGEEFLLKVKIDDYESDLLPLSLHSDGIITHTSMVAELAYRCLVLNAHHADKAIEKSKGIVMIDELDLHLHPNWQKRVVRDLKLAFPNLQFIVTTHSPFIVQSLDSNELINLDGSNPSVDPTDLTLNKVATDVMGVKGLNADDFMARYSEAYGNLLAIQNSKGTLTLDDYEEVNKILSQVLIKDTVDPIYKAFLQLKNEEDEAS
ncbi:AAA family ATPase [soil metagenome]